MSTEKTTPKKQVAKKEEAGLPATFLTELASAGEEFAQSMGRDDMSIPFLSILQSLSPQCTRGEPEYIKGAEQSNLFHTVSQQLFATRDDDDQAIPAPFEVISIHYKRSFIEWVPRSKGGGFVNEYSVEEGVQIVTAREGEANLDIIQQGSPYGTPGNQLSDTHTHFVFLLFEDGTYEPAVITASMTQLKPSKDWNALISRLRLPSGQQPPRYFGVWNVTTRRRSNDQGSWYVWEFSKARTLLDLAPDLAQRIHEEATAFARSIISGEVKADHAKNAPASGDASSDDAAANVADEDIPF